MHEGVNMSDAAPPPMIRTSERGTFKRCPQRWWWGWREGLKPVDTKPALWFGTGIHLVLEHHYSGPGLKRGKNPLKVWRDYCQDASITVIRNSLSDQGTDTAFVDAKKMGEAMIDGYMEMWGKDDHIHVLQPEHSFQINIPDGHGGIACTYCGTYDLAWRDLRDDSVWITDHKTAKDFSVQHLALDDQAGSYWALATQTLREKGLIGKRESLKGIEYNFLLKFLPPQDDRPINADGLRCNKPTAAELREFGPDFPGSPSKRQPKPLDQRFMRYRVHRTPGERKSQIERIANEAAVMNLYRTKQLPLIKNPTRDCSWDCDFKNLCEVHERGGDWQDFKRIAYRVEDPYAAHRDSVEEG